MTGDHLARPGYKVKLNKDGSQREYWDARADLVRRGYPIKRVRLHYDQSPFGRAQLAARCQMLQAEMLVRAGNEGKIPSLAATTDQSAACAAYSRQMTCRPSSAA